jgi:hypothetical protein
MREFYQFKEDENQINVFDERWYRREIDGETKFYRNVTTILDIVDKGYGFRQYLKQSGFRADYILAKAGEFGDVFHNYTARYDAGFPISYYELEEEVGKSVAMELWKRLVRYVEFVDEQPAEILHIEKIVYSDIYEYAGTCDRIVKNGDVYEVWDIKTGNGVYKTYFQQLAAYRQAVKETLGIDCQVAKILWFPDKKEETDEEGKVTYHPNKKGYRIIELDAPKLDYYFDVFLATKKLFDSENSDTPSFLTLPIKLQKGEKVEGRNSGKNKVTRNK